MPDLTASPGRQPGPMPMANMGHNNTIPQRHANSASGGIKEPVLIQGDFRKVSGISSDIFRQIEAVENDHDPSTAQALEAVERRGEMIVRMLEPRFIGGRSSVEAAQKFLAKGDGRHTVQVTISLYFPTALFLLNDNLFPVGGDCEASWTDTGLVYTRGEWC